VLVLYAIVIAAMGGSLMLWAKYNHLRFRGMDRRKDGVAPSTADLAMLQGNSAIEIEEWQSSSAVTVHHDDAGRIIRIVPATAKATAISAVKPAVNAA
jgi:biofilm PGA synthesis protein PgaD